GHGQLAEYRRLLRQVAYAEPRAAIHRLAGAVAPVEHDAAVVGRHQADDHVEAGGLAGAVGAEQADNLAGVQRQPEVADDLARPVALAQAFCEQHQLPPSWRPPRGSSRIFTRPASPPPASTRSVCKL